MVQINFGQREVSCKVVFYGPGMSGKTTNLEIIHKKAPKDAVGEMVSIATETDRTLYFDFLPLDLGQVAGMRTKFQLYTVPGQIYYNATRKLVLQGVDGVIFVADSSPEKMPENLESLQNLRDNLSEMGLTLEDVPLVLQYNKRDLPTAMTIPDMNAQMNPMNAPVFEGVAREGKGVFATLKEISRLVIEKLNKDHAPAATRRRTASNLDGRSPSGGAPVQSSPSGANKLPPMPAGMPSGVAARPPAPMPPQQQATSTTPMGQQRLPPRPAAPAPAPTVRQQGSGGVPVVPTRGQGTPGQRPTYTPTPAAGSPIVPPPEDMSPKDKHLAKAKPPAIDKRTAGANPDLGATDPNLRRYQEKKSGGGAMRAMLLVLVFLLIFIVILFILCMFVPAVRAQLPPNLQRMFLGETQSPAAVAPLPAASAPAATSAPAPAPGASAPTLGDATPPTAPQHPVPTRDPVPAAPAKSPNEAAVTAAPHPAPEPAATPATAPATAPDAPATPATAPDADPAATPAGNP